MKNKITQTRIPLDSLSGLVERIRNYFLIGSRRLQPAELDFERNLKVATTSHFKFSNFSKSNIKDC